MKLGVLGKCEKCTYNLYVCSSYYLLQESDVCTQKQNETIVFHFDCSIFFVVHIQHFSYISILYICFDVFDVYLFNLRKIQNNAFFFLP